MPPSGAARAGAPKDHGPARGPADVYIRCVLEHLFELLFRDSVVAAMLYIASRIVVEVPDDRGKNMASVGPAVEL